ncbi:SpoIIE family protein phosphatase [Streptomyces sp. NPDC047108]|uniref:SpoIIE family protein phosphatase n=1 Tax=Streptomyces sp. NPDC047108 TaxID=3155025 RepID=UPI0033EA4B29
MVDIPVTTPGEGPDDPFAVHRSATAVLDGHGTIVGWSRQAQELLGYRSDEVMGRPARDFLVHPQDEERVMGELAACVESEGCYFGIVPVRRRDGERVDLGCRVRVVARPDGPEWFVVGAPAEQVMQWETDRSVLDGMFRRCPIGLVVHDPELKFLRVNRAIARFGEIPPEAFPGLSLGDFLMEPETDRVETQLRRVLATGEPTIFIEQRGRLQNDPGQERVVSISAFRMEDPAGRVLGVTETVEDVTERYRARKRLALVNEAGARIGTTLDVAETARELAAVAVPDLADCVSVDLLEPVPRGGETSKDSSGALSRAAVLSVSAEASDLMYPVGHVMRFPSDAPQALCMAEQHPVLEAVLRVSPGWSSLDPDKVERVRDLGVHSLIAVPLMARGLVLGVVSLWRWRRPEPFEEDDLTLAEELAARAAVCIDNARRYTQQHEAALALQRSLLPGGVPEHPAVEVAHRYLPADATAGVGGDWFDVIPLSGLRIALVVGDVVGHGIHAAATMGRLRTAVHTLAYLDLPPDEVLSHLDDLVDRLAAEQEPNREPVPQVVGATCLYAVYDPVSRRCSFARAGHPPPAVASADGSVWLPDSPVGPPLGLGSLPFESAELELPEGSVLALYTDGLIRAQHRDLDEGLARLRTALSDPSRPVEAICAAVENALPPDRSHDDAALLVARTRGLPSHQVATWQLPAEPTAAARARALTATQLTEWGLGEIGFTTELIVSELVTNAYRYGGGPVVLRLIRDSHLICEVSDTSSTSPHLRRARTTDEGGRGLFLVAQLTERWGTRYVRDGKTIWTEQPLVSAPEVGGLGEALLSAEW